MPTTLQIREFQDGLTVIVKEPKRLGRAALWLVSGSAFLLLLSKATDASKSEILLSIAFSVFILIKGIVAALRGTAVELSITEHEFISSGHAPEDYSPSIIARADVYNLEFREASGGGDFPELPKGLYAQHHGGLLHNPSTCILPNLDKAQTEGVIAAIYKKFPDTGSLPPTGAFEPYVTSLNLNRKDRE